MAESKVGEARFSLIIHGDDLPKLQHGFRLKTDCRCQ